MCNRYANYLRKLDRFAEHYGYEEFSETRINVFAGRVKEDVFPKYPALVWRGPGHEVEAMRWGFPPPPNSRAPVTNVRNTRSPFWRAWLKPEWRTLVPASSFAEFSHIEPKGNRWFGRRDGDPFFFAGLCRPHDWNARPGDEGFNADAMTFAFLTTEPNAVVKPWHEKAMPVILTTPQEVEMWLNAPTDVALELQRPLADDQLMLLGLTAA